MNSKRVLDDIRYLCVDCARTVLPVSYRAACPDCGGDLESVTVLR